MKQKVTKEQWDELTQKEKCQFLNCSNNWRNVKTMIASGLPTIGQMIQFLGDYWYEDVSEENDCYDQNEEVCGSSFSFTSNEKLVDALWEAVKSKLK